MVISSSSRIRGRAAFASLIILAALASGVQAATPAPEAETLPVAVAANDPHLLYAGRFDQSDAAGPRCAWPASNVTIHFEGSAANARLAGGTNDRWQILIDGNPAQVITLAGKPALFRIASDLPVGPHEVTLMKCGETFFGTTQILGFQLSQDAKLLEAHPAPHELEVIGDSISCGYGDEAKSQKDHFKAETENAGLAYGALAARALDADYVCIAWSGKCLWPKNSIVDLYGRTLAQDDASRWTFSGRQPDAVLINLGTNDFAGGNPEEKGWVAAYRKFIGEVRQHYPHTAIFCALGPMLSDQWSPSKNALSTCRRYLKEIVAGCRKDGVKDVYFVEFPMQDGSNGFGADWHPSLKQHEAMAKVLEAALREKLGWGQ